MFAAFGLLLVAICHVNGWPYQEMDPGKMAINTITDCMHVASEEGYYSFKKYATSPSSTNLVLDTGEPEDEPAAAVCGLYVVADPDMNVEFTLKYLNVQCKSGGLMAFVDGWELNGQYFPSIDDHQLPLDKRVTELCSNTNMRWPFRPTRRTFRSSQNAALLQYRVPDTGSFLVSVRFVANNRPCHIMATAVAPEYTLRNYGERSNCTLTALYPAVVGLMEIDVGRDQQKMKFRCNGPDRLDIGGSSGLDSHGMQIASSACGISSENAIDAPVEQAIFCGVTTVRMVSSGNYANRATISMRQAAEEDLDLMTGVCDA